MRRLRLPPAAPGINKCPISGVSGKVWGFSSRQLYCPLLCAPGLWWRGISSGQTQKRKPQPDCRMRWIYGRTKLLWTLPCKGGYRKEVKALWNIKKWKTLSIYRSTKEKISQLYGWSCHYSGSWYHRQTVWYKCRDWGMEILLKDRGCFYYVSEAGIF